MSKKQAAQSLVTGLSYGRKNLYLFILGLISIVIGFIFMAQPPVNGFLSRTLAPVILVVAYLVIIPAALLLKDN